MTATQRPTLLASVYPLLLAFMAGAAMVDQMYVRTLRAALPAGIRGVPMSNVADALLLMVLPVLVAGGMAMLVSKGRARVLYAASLVVFSLEFLTPVFATAVPSGAVYLQMAGPFLRMVVVLGALSLAFMATRQAAR